jgi:hypothetical protein
MRRLLAGWIAAVLIGLAGMAAYGQSAGRMTNQDVIRMVQTGLPETAIVASIQRSVPAFDLSANGLIQLKQAGVSAAIAAAMLRAEWATPGTPGTPSGSPSATGGNGLTPGAGQPAQQKLATLAAKAHSAKGVLAPVTTNPNGGQGDTATLTALQQQKQTALNERGTQTSSPTATMNPAISTMRVPVGAAAPPAQSSTRTGTLIGARTNMTVACTTLSGPAIQTVSGQQASAIFSQDPTYNPFTIRGCNFGNTKGQAQLNTAAGKKLATLNVDSWTDGLITVEVDPTLTDALDQSNVTLVVFPASGPQTQKSGFRFYAKRAEIPLGSIPASSASLTSIKDDGGSPVKATFSSPYQLIQSGVSTAVSAGVDRVNTVRFVGGTDVFDFSKLKPGFVVSRYQVNELSNATCSDLGPTTTTNYTDGTWSWQLSGNTIRVTWQEAHCHDAYFGDASDASYGLSVWAVGPVLSSSSSPWQ